MERKVRTILFFISSLRQVCSDRLDGIYRYAAGRDWRVQIVERAYHRIRVKEALDFWKPAGIIAECGSGVDDPTLKELAQYPIVYIDANPSPREPRFCVGQDNAAVSRLAAQHLLSLGFPNYAFASFRIPMYWNAERRDAFVEAITKAGKGCLVFDTDREVRQIRRQVALYEWVRVLPRPCGVFAANDYVGEEIVNVAGQLGIRIPSELAILGVDNDERICENLPVTLSSIALDFEEAGYLAAELLDRRMAEPKTMPVSTPCNCTLRDITRHSISRWPRCLSST